MVKAVSSLMGWHIDPAANIFSHILGFQNSSYGRPWLCNASDF